MGDRDRGWPRLVKVRGIVNGDGSLHLAITPELPPGPVEVTVLIQPADSLEMHDLGELRGLGARIWQGMDAQAFVDTLRNEWERQ